MKKFITISFLCVFLYQLMGYFLVFVWVQQQIKLEVKTKIAESVDVEGLVSIKFHIDAKINWIEEGREFLFQHKMYDIVSQKTMGDTLYLSCYFDKEESELMADLEDYMQYSLLPPASQKAKNLLNLLPKDYFIQDYISFFNVASVHNYHYEIASPAIYVSKNTAVLSPPPKTVTVFVG